MVKCEEGKGYNVWLMWIWRSTQHFVRNQNIILSRAFFVNRHRVVQIAFLMFGPCLVKNLISIRNIHKLSYIQCTSKLWKKRWKQNPLCSRYKLFLNVILCCPFLFRLSPPQAFAIVRICSICVRFPHHMPVKKARGKNFAY